MTLKHFVTERFPFSNRFLKREGKVQARCGLLSLVRSIG